MWMEVHIYSVKANSQAGNIWVKDIMTKVKAIRYSARNLKNLHIFPENSAEGLGCRRERCLRYIVFVFEKTPKNLLVQGRTQLKRSSTIVKVSVEAACLHFNPWSILKETTKPAGPFGTMRLEPWHPEGGAEVRTREVIKQPKHGRISTIEEEKGSSFQMNYD